MQFCGIKQNDMEKTLIQLIKAVASKLHNSKLKRLGGKEMVLSLNCLKELLGLYNTEEAIIFTALFDRSCSGRSCDIDDIASYFDCTQLDIMEYVSVIKSLLKKGFIVQTNLSECRIARQDYMVTNYVINCILENIKPEYRKARMLDKEFDRYDFCKLVDSQIQDSDVTAEALFQFIETLEQDNHEMQIVKDLKNTITDIQSRALFYEVCFDFFNQDGDGRSSLNRTLSDMYEVFDKLKLIEHDNPLTEEDVESALEVYSKEYYNFKISDIEYLTDLHIERNKRNGRKQSEHIKRITLLRDSDYPNGEWRNKNGRPSAESVVEAFLRENPEARKCDVIRGTGLDKKTVYKYYEAAKEKTQLKPAEPIVAAGLDTEELRAVFSRCENLQRIGRVDRVNRRD